VIFFNIRQNVYVRASSHTTYNFVVLRTISRTTVF